MAKKETSISKKEISVMDITNVDPKKLAEFKGWEKKQLEILKENQFVPIQDHTTYTLAKKRRTALKTGRTDLQKQEKLIAGKLLEFRRSIGKATVDLIQITEGAEDKQQAEINAWEEKKAQEKREKELAEKKRIEDLREEMVEVLKTGSTIIYNMTYETIESHRECSITFATILI